MDPDGGGGLWARLHDWTILDASVLEVAGSPSYPVLALRVLLVPYTPA